MRFTKIVATIGPACGTPEGIEELAKCGANVCRLNFSHGSHESHGKVIKYVKDINKKGKYSLALLLDVRGSGILDVLNNLSMRLMRAVGKVEAADVGTALGKLLDSFGSTASRSDRCYDFCETHTKGEENDEMSAPSSVAQGMPKYSPT
jgi:hypothetical protein